MKPSAHGKSQFPAGKRGRAVQYGDSAEEAATGQETIVHSETAVEAATHQEIEQRQLTREAGARKKGREEIK